MHLSRWSECDCLHSLACLPLLLVHCLHCLYCVLAVFLSVAHMHTCHFMSFCFQYHSLHFCFLSRRLDIAHTWILFLRARSIILDLKLLYVLANFINHLIATLVAYKMLRYSLAFTVFCLLSWLLVCSFFFVLIFLLLKMTISNQCFFGISVFNLLYLK